MDLLVCNHKREGAFTLIEILLSMALLAILVAFSLPTFNVLFYTNDLDVAKNQVAQSLNRASFLSSASQGDTTWGVKVSAGEVVIFKGSSYAARDTEYDESYNISPSIALTGISEIVFEKMTGLPQTTGNIILTSPNGQTRTVTINAKGSINY